MKYILGEYTVEGPSLYCIQQDHLKNVKYVAQTLSGQTKLTKLVSTHELLSAKTSANWPEDCKTQKLCTTMAQCNTSNCIAHLADTVNISTLNDVSGMDISGQTIILNFTGPPSDLSSAVTTAFNITESSVTVQNLDISGWNPSSSLASVFKMDTSSSLTISGCTFQHCGKDRLKKSNPITFITLANTSPNFSAVLTASAEPASPTPASPTPASPTPAPPTPPPTPAPPTPPPVPQITVNTFTFNNNLNCQFANINLSVPLTLDTARFVDNSSTINYPGGIISISADTVQTITMKGGTTFKHNISTKDSSGYGGAISSISDLIITGSGEFVDNEANGAGAISLQTGSLTVGTLSYDSFTFNSNKSNGQAGTGGGGAIYAPSMTLDGSFTFNSNTSKVNGGALLASPGAGFNGRAVITLNNGPFTFNNNVCAGGTKAGTMNGGAISVHGTGDISINLTSDNILTLTGNQSHDSGGAIYCTSGDIDISGDIYTGGSDSAVGINLCTSGNGGVIYGRNITILSNHLELNNNVCAKMGGHIFATGDVSINAEKIGVLKLGNSASNRQDSTYGGGIYAGGAVNIIGPSWEFTKNYAYGTADGGAIYAKGAITLDGSFLVVGNIAYGSGGAIYSKSAITLDGNFLVKGNIAYGGYGGGALYSENKVVLSKGPYNFDQNTCPSGNGGAIHSNSGDVEIAANSSVNFNGNIAGNRGGAIYAKSGVKITTPVFAPFSIIVNTFQKNSANMTGGAISCGKNISLTGTYTISGNVAKSSGSTLCAGGAFFAGGDIDLSGGDYTFSNNKAAANSKLGYAHGGALYGQDVVVLNARTCNLSNNSAINTSTEGGKGGAIYAVEVYFMPSSTTKFSSISGNTVGGASINTAGSAIYSEGNLILSGRTNINKNGLTTWTYALEANSLIKIGFSPLSNVVFDDNGSVYHGKHDAHAYSATELIQYNNTTWGNPSCLPPAGGVMPVKGKGAKACPR